MVMNYKDRILEINNRITQLDAELDSASLERIEEIRSEVKTLTEERTELTKKIAAEARQGFQASIQKVETKDDKNEMEERARKLLQGRAITVASLDILHIDHQSDTINPTFNQVSSLVDLIPVTGLNGGETYSKAYVKSYGVAGYTTEGGAPTVSEPTFGYADIKKTKITAYTEVSEEFEKLAPSMYLAEVKKNLSISLKKKLAVEILKGAGTTNSLVGIFSANAAAIETAKDIEIEAIDENTLDEILFSYGGDEEMAAGILILSKADLKAFSKVRGSDKKRVYTIDYNNRTIDGIPYVINSAITPLATATAGDYVMAFGALPNYTLTSFSPVEISKSTDYKFKEGQIAYKAVGFFGGNVTSFNGFLRIKKKAAPAG